MYRVCILVELHFLTCWSCEVIKLYLLVPVHRGSVFSAFIDIAIKNCSSCCPVYRAHFHFIATLERSVSLLVLHSFVSQPKSIKVSKSSPGAFRWCSFCTTGMCSHSLAVLTWHMDSLVKSKAFFNWLKNNQKKKKSKKLVRINDFQVLVFCTSASVEKLLKVFREENPNVKIKRNLS